MKVKTRVPLLNRGMVTLEEWLKRFAFTKPTKRLGGGWIADRVACRRNIILCPTCTNKYGNWYDTVNYKPDWDYSPAYQQPGFASDCDGCGKTYLGGGCTGFFPAESFTTILSKDLHGNKANPKRLWFSRF